MSTQTFSPISFQTFGDLLKYLRRREHLTQLELSIIAGYSEAQIGRLEKNQRRPDITALKALFIPALHLDNDPDITMRFLELAESARQEDAPIPGVAPYKGLLFFDEGDADLFFGREALTAHLTDRVTALTTDASTRLLAVVGASGSGKSSLVRAGLVVSLRHAGWDVRVFTPGANPLRALEMQIDRDQVRAESDRFLIVADQFEEVFTLCRDESERAMFIQKLIALAQHASHKTTVVITLRADFYSHCAQYPTLRKAVAAQQEYIGQMTTEELRRAIEEPAHYGKWEFEPGLVDVLLQDIGADGARQPEPGALPLLSHALLATWEHRRGRTFTLDGYHASGGVRGAIAETAESVFTDQLNREGQELAQSVFLRLTELGEGTEDTRRRAALNELVNRSEQATQLRAVLNTLAEARLITLNEDNAEVAHEALIREWGRLREWLAQDREGLRLHRHLTESAREWEVREHDVSELYRGARLAQANEWASANEGRLNESERAFLKASIDHEHHEALEHEMQRQRELEAVREIAETKSKAEARLRLRNRVITFVGVVAVVLAIFAGVFAVQASRQREEALRQASIGLASQATLELNGTSPERSVLLALEALENYPYTWQAEQALGQIIREFRLRHIVSGHDDTIMDVAWSPDGTKFATTGKDGTLRIWDAQSHKELIKIQAHPALVAGITLGTHELAWSPDGTQIATAGLDKKAKVWDVATGNQNSAFDEHTDEVWGVTWSRDGQWVASASKDGTVKVWDAQTGKEKFTFSKHTGWVKSVAWSPDGSMIASAGEDGIARIFNAETGDEQLVLTGHTNSIRSVAWSPNGTQFVTASDDGTVRIWDSETGKELSDIRLASPVWDVAWSPNGLQLATTNADGVAQVWDVLSGKEKFSLQGRTLEQFDIAWSPDGKFLATTGGAGYSLLIWNATPATITFSGAQKRMQWVSWSPDGNRLATTGLDKTAMVWDAKTGKPLLTFAEHTDWVQDAFWSPDGTRIVTTDWDNVAKVWDAKTGNVLVNFTGHVGEPIAKFNGTDALFGSGWSPDGTRIMTQGGDGSIRIWDAETGQEYLMFHATKDVGGATRWSPDGKHLAGCAIPGVFQLWDAETGEAIIGGYVHNTADLAFGDAVDFCMPGGWSPDGKKVLMASWGGNGATIWDANSGEKLIVYKGNTGGMGFPTWSPNGERIATGDTNGEVKIWDAETGNTLLSFSVPSENFLFQLDWSPDGTRLTGAGLADSIEIYRVWQTTEDLIAYAKECCVVRELTPEERQQFGLP